MSKFYFTFGSSEDHAHPRMALPIVADSYAIARDAMFKLYGDKWAFQYTEEEWECMKQRAKSEAFFNLESELDEINADDVLGYTSKNDMEVSTNE